MTITVLYAYLTGWAVTTAGLAVITRHQGRRMSVVVAAGVGWPLLALGGAQFAALAVVGEMARIRRPSTKSIDDELDELLTQWAIDDPGARGRRIPVTTGGDNVPQSTLGS